MHSTSLEVLWRGLVIWTENTPSAFEWYDRWHVLALLSTIVCLTPLSQANSFICQNGPTITAQLWTVPFTPSIIAYFFALIGPTRMPGLLLDCTLALWTKILHRKVYFSHDRPQDDRVVWSCTEVYGTSIKCYCESEPFELLAHIC